MILTAFVFFIVLSILVLIHELGHFLVARAVGVRVDEFGMGLPPRIIGKKIHNTLYSLNWLPIGGFVKLAGEDEEEEDLKKVKDTKSYFWGRSPLERSLILIAGVTMNFLLAVGITAFLLMGGVNEPSGHVKIEDISPGSPAAAVGLQKGDEIYSIKSAVTLDTSKPVLIKTPADMITLTKKLAGSPIQLTVVRSNQSQIFVVTPRKNPPKGEGSLGVAITDLVIKKYAIQDAPIAAFRINIERARDMLVGVVQTLVGLITFKNLSPDIAGPIGIAQVTGQAVKFGWKAVLEFISILSLNLAVINILPIPALDGGRLAFVIIEKIFGKKIKPSFEKQTHQIGMIILLALVLLVSINDIARLARGGS